MRCLFLVLLLILAGCQRQEPQRYTFQHRSDGIYRYDHTAGDVHILRAGTWQRVVEPAINSQAAD